MDPVAITQRMRKPIPRPRAPVAKPAQSWAQLKPGQTLVNTEACLGLPPGTPWRVCAVDSLGAQLHGGDDVWYRLTDRNWSRLFNRARTRKAKR